MRLSHEGELKSLQALTAKLIWRLKLAMLLIVVALVAGFALGYWL
jgi:hypothetical protein